MAAPHNIGVEPFFEDRPGAGFHYRFPRYSRGTLSMFFEFVFNPLRIFPGEQV